MPPKNKTATLEDLEDVQAQLSDELRELKKSIENKYKTDYQKLKEIVEDLKQSNVSNNSEINREIENMKDRLKFEIEKIQTEVTGKIQEMVSVLEPLNKNVLKDQKILKELEIFCGETLKEVEQKNLQSREEAKKNLDQKIEICQNEIDKANLNLTKKCDKFMSDNVEEYKNHLNQIYNWTKQAKQSLDDEVVDMNVKVETAVANARDIYTRRVEWKIFNFKNLVENCKLSEAIYSPPFGAGGCGQLRLEIKIEKKRDFLFSEKGAAEIDWVHDCALYLWGSKGLNIKFVLNLEGEISLKKTFENSYEAEYSAFGGLSFPSCHVYDKFDGSLLVVLDILEASSYLPILHAKTDKVHVPLNTVEFESSVKITRFVNNRVLDLVRKYMENIRNRGVKEIQWKLAGLKDGILKTFKQNECLKSIVFSVAGLEELQLLFYPYGYDGACNGYCSFFLSAPAGVFIVCYLYVNNAKLLVKHFFKERGAFGRVNFCITEKEMKNDNLVLGLEIVEAVQELVNEDSVGDVTRSYVKLRRHVHSNQLEGIRLVETEKI